MTVLLQYPRIARRIQNMPEYTVITVVGLVMNRPAHSCNQSMPTGDIEVEIQDIVNIDFSAGAKRPGDKRSYSTMAQENYTGITSTEYKMASKLLLFLQYCCHFLLLHYIIIHFIRIGEYIEIF